MINTTNESLLLLGILSGVLGIVLYVWTALALAGLFRKVGEQTWQAWVPLLNIGVVLGLGGFSPWLVLLALVPGPGTLAVHVLVVISAHRIGRGFAAGPGMTVLAALLFVVWASILGLGPAVWRAPRRDAPQPPWAFAPPMSEFTPLLEHRMGGAAPGEEIARHAATEVSATEDSETRLSPTGLTATQSSSTDAFAETSVADAGDGAHIVRRDLSPAEFEPSPWAPPEPARHTAPEYSAPAASADPPRPAAPSTEQADAADGPGANPNAPSTFPSAAEPASAGAPSAAPASGSAAPGLTADVAATPVDEPTPAAALRPPAAPAGEDDDGWSTEIDDVSAISPSPFFPPSAASTRPGVVPSLADADDQAPRPATRRTWDAVPASSGRRSFAPAPDEFPELSEEVSAVIGAPAAGAPRTANAAVPAQQRRAEADRDDAGLDDLEAADHTVVVARRRTSWQLVTVDGVVVPLTSDVVVIGRQPAPDPAHPRAQLVGIDDSTRTVSKTHARLELRSDVWHITDLQSTNGVVLITFLGAEIELEPGSNAPAGDRFLLGDAELRLERPGS